MAVYFSEIIKLLDPIYPIRSKVVEDHLIESIHALDAQNDFSAKDHIYVGSLTDFLKISPAPSKFSNYIIIDNLLISSDLIFENESNIIFVKSSNSIKDVFNTLELIINQAGALYDYNIQLLNHLTKSNGIKQVVNLTAELIGNSIIILDSTFDVIYSYCFRNSYPGNVFRDAIVKNRYVPEHISLFSETDSEPNIIPVVYHDKETNADVSLRILHLTYKAMNWNINYGHILIFEEDTPLDSVSMTLISAFTNFLSLKMQFQFYTKPIPVSTLDHFLKNMLSGSSYSDTELKFRMEHFKWKINTGYLIFIPLSENYKSKTLQGILRTFMNRNFNNSYSIEFRGNFITFVSLENTSFFSDDTVMNSLQDTLSKNRLQGIVSLIFENFSQVSECYRQVLAAYQYALDENSSETLIFYSNYLFKDILVMANHKIPVRSLCDPSLIKMIKYDKDKHTEYAFTLNSYLNNCQNVKYTAKAMNVHYNTLQYRLNRISELFDLDLDDGRRMYNLYFSFKILNYANKINDTSSADHFLTF